jgi:hypothetical protein
VKKTPTEAPWKADSVGAHTILRRRKIVMQNVAHEPHDVSPTDRALWETAVCLAATKARAALPHSNGRIGKAVALVLGGAVEVLDDHSARVTSQTDGATQYYVVNGTCQCHDFPHAPQLMCKHRIARGIAVRAREIARDLADAGAQPVSPQPAIPSEFLVQIQGKPFITFQGLLHLAHQRGLLHLSEEVTHVTDTYVLAQARAIARRTMWGPGIRRIGDAWRGPGPWPGR